MPLIKSPEENSLLQIYECGQTIADFYFREKPIISKYLRIGYIISGKGFITANGISYEIQAGDTYIIRPGAHYYYNSDPEAPMNKLWLHFSGTLINDILDFYNLKTKIMLFKNADSYELMDKIHKMCLKYNDFYTLRSETNMQLLKLTELLAKVFFKDKAYLKTADALKMYIDINTANDIGTDDLVTVSKMSKDHTIRIFKENTGLTPHQYILNRKIELSKFYLQATECSIDQIASELGFCDGTHFSYTFAQRTGIRPSKYKKLIKTLKLSENLQIHIDNSPIL